MIQLDGAGSGSNHDRLLIMGATNLPQELDTAVLRRLARRIYIPLPDREARVALIKRLFGPDQPVQIVLSDREWDQIVTLADGYSCSDINTLCKEAAMVPVRDLAPQKISDARHTDVRPVCLSDFQLASRRVHPSVSEDTLLRYTKWEKNNSGFN
mmetsp:Transcript_33063/g.44775  ORF Transcript_33063/g.44775 Transcript_33063/m.44775 type:complete len:155 (-) Transcript_33063:368-832(-)